ncbi:ArsR/SmtB family transcription factor [Mangrovihabitans endophyticus]|uniref:Transcriptional regulator n=1 Tax=Mangrovihabitans endophyticus TaxID=1751298 RepID=A0A8J3BZP2_9ACTN|nr:winged helix-turn-helix domain-containing protein [Mangrovihabitans endophyticus]GGK97095.1 transcriptional regulator [Mangrovihabitans endophyticus]
MTAPRNQMTIRDPQVMRALAHPARIEIMERLNGTDASVTATECADLVGLSPSAASYHLRELAKFGLIEQAPSRGDGRERVWRSAAEGLRIEGAMENEEDRRAEQTLIEGFLARDFARIKDWYTRRHEAPQEWREAATVMTQKLQVTPGELAEISAQVQAILEPYRERERTADTPPDAATVAVLFTAHPA